MPSALHEQLIKALLADLPGAQTNGFKRALKTAIPDHDEGCFEVFNIHPDAFWIDHEEETVAVYEVEVRGPMTERKLEAYRELYWVLSWHDWDLVLITANRFGHRHAQDVALLACGEVVRKAQEGLRANA